MPRKPSDIDQYIQVNNARKPSDIDQYIHVNNARETIRYRSVYPRQ